VKSKRHQPVWSKYSNALKTQLYTYNTSPPTKTATTTANAIIRYTINGTIPTQTNGFTYSSPVSVSANLTLIAYAYESGMTDSPITSGGYTVQSSGGGAVYLTNYTYDMLGHLTQVSMPRGATTQTRTFNYTTGTTVGAHLLSATNPENGTVSYTYSNHLLSTKTDAAGNQFTYGYDPLHRLTSVSANGSVLRTYTYDTNTIDASYSTYTAGRLATVTYPAYTYDAQVNGQQGTTTFTDMFSYSQPGAVVGKRLRVTKTNPYTQFGQQQTQTAVGDLNLAYAYNNEGKPTTVTYPTDVYNNTPGYNYSYDAMMRPQGMTDQGSNSVVSNVQYGAANQLLQMTMGGPTETRTYNNMLQLTDIAYSGSPNQNIHYTFPSANNGKISSQILNGENISYVYDSLNRLTSASGDSGGGWGQAYTYDGFGNLTNRTGSGAAQSTTISTPADPATNRLSGYGYDANGNQLSVGYHYDAENRLVQANMQGGTMQYGYDGQNKRIWQGTFTNANDPQYLSSDKVSVFGVDGKLIGSYTTMVSWTNSTTQLPITFPVSATRVYFAGKLLGRGQDRLGSIGKYYPYGEERNSPPLSNDQVKFATYTRDSATGNDYADQRYYTSTLGRFTSPDRYLASGGPNEPGSWNRYSYVGGDPVNFTDRHGLFRCGNCVEDDPDDDQEEPGYCAQNPEDCYAQRPPGNPQQNRPQNLIKVKTDALKRAQSMLGRAKELAKAGLDKSQCASLFGSKDGMTAAQVLAGTAPGTTWIIQFAYDADPNAAVANTRPTISLDNIFGLHSFITRIDDAWFDQGFWNYGDNLDNADTILHELGHVLRLLGFTGGDFVQNDGDPKVSHDNDDRIRQNCLNGMKP
jgi:RHS repeat-associated protein